jgi:hypothetical protein
MRIWRDGARRVGNLDSLNGFGGKSMAEERIFRKTCHGIEVYLLVDGVLTQPEDLHELEPARGNPDSLYHGIARMIQDTLAMLRGKFVPSR